MVAEAVRDSFDGFTAAVGASAVDDDIFHIRREDWEDAVDSATEAGIVVEADGND